MAFTHLDDSARPMMVDVSAKAVTVRVAEAVATVALAPEVLARMEGDELISPKGAVLQTAIIAGIQAAKRTDELIPLCHSLPIDRCHINIVRESDSTLVIRSTVGTTAKTGVEMEALTACSVAALTVYDMCKGFKLPIVISEIRLVSKTGGRS